MHKEGLRGRVPSIADDLNQATLTVDAKFSEITNHQIFINPISFQFQYTQFQYKFASFA